MPTSLLAFVLLLLAAVARPAVAQIQLCPPQKLAALRASLPATDDERWQNVFDDPRTLYYTDTEIPLAYQHADKGLLVGGRFIGQNPNTSFHSPQYNISGDAREAAKGHGRGGNGNIEFPWRNPGGTDHGEGSVRTFKLMRLPDREDGGVWPVAWWPEVLSGARVGNHLGYAWSYPVGTIFGECLCLTDRAGELHTFEVRLRIRQADFWDVEILRPFPTAADLAKRLESTFELKDDGQVNNSVARNWVSHLQADQPLAEGKLIDQLHPTQSGFAAKAGVDQLPTFGEQLAKELLDTTPFKSALGAEWKRGSNGVVAHSPTTNETFSIVPRNYHGTFMGTDTDSCAKCHESTLMHVDRFDRQRDWYGYVRGSADGIFSFHPIDPASISYNGGSRQVAFRRAFIEAGMFERYDAAKHPRDRYSLFKR